MRMFFAYPGHPSAVAACIRAAADHLPRRAPDRVLQLWERNDIASRPITDPIFSHLDETDVLFADITQTNFNVAFEIGYAIGARKRVFLVRNKGLAAQLTIRP
jgi:nucleoside 2-deoxyribosyltransferase